MCFSYTFFCFWYAFIGIQTQKSKTSPPPRPLSPTPTIDRAAAQLVKMGLPSRVYSTDPSPFYYILLRDPLVGGVTQKNYSLMKWTLYVYDFGKCNFFRGYGVPGGRSGGSRPPLEVRFNGTGFAFFWGHEGVQQHHGMSFYTKRHM